jgi:CDP-4-dehydro-6-deoxyglucose reductase
VRTPADRPQRVTYEARIEKIIARAPNTRSLFLRLPPSPPFAFIPGQFISCLLPLNGEPAVRPYSIASNPEESGLLEICLNLVAGGLGSRYLFGLSTGATVRFTGPWGTFTLERPPAAECVFIAEGTGIAPIRPMLRRALQTASTYPLRLHYAAASAARLLYADEFARAAREHERFTFAPLLGGSLVECVRQEYVTRDNDRNRHFYICAVGSIVLELRDLLRREGYERRAVQYEKW